MRKETHIEPQADKRPAGWPASFTHLPQRNFVASWFGDGIASWFGDMHDLDEGPTQNKPPLRMALNRWDAGTAVTGPSAAAC